MTPEHFAAFHHRRKAELAALRAEQDVQEAIYDELCERLQGAEWDALRSFNTYCARHCGVAVEFYRRADGQADDR